MTSPEFSCELRLLGFRVEPGRKLLIKSGILVDMKNMRYAIPSGELEN